MHVVMIGTGYVGLVSGACLAEVGHHVICVDVNQSKIDLLKQSISPIFEPGLEKMLSHNIQQERLFFTTDLKFAIQDAEIIFIAVGTPEEEDGSADLQYVKSVAESIGDLIQRKTLVIVKSTVPVGTCDLVAEIIEKKIHARNVHHSISVASNPEFLKEGSAIQDCMKPDRIIVGISDEWAENILRELYQPFIIVDTHRLHIMSRRSSELTKYASNAMLATRISFMNELSYLCEKLGANIDDIRNGVGSDPRIGRNFLYAGPGFGGSCFPKDIVALLNTADNNGVPLRVLKAVDQANDAQKKRVAEKIVDYFQGNLQSRKISIWGLTFKPNTDDVRETPAKTIIEILLKKGAKITAHDPEAMKNFENAFGKKLILEYARTAYEALENADALVLVTEWAEYRQPNWDQIAKRMRGKVIFDFRNQYQHHKLAEKGFTRIAVGQ